MPGSTPFLHVPPLIHLPPGHPGPLHSCIRCGEEVHGHLDRPLRLEAVEAGKRPELLVSKAPCPHLKAGQVCISGTSQSSGKGQSANSAHPAGGRTFCRSYFCFTLHTTFEISFSFCRGETEGLEMLRCRVVVSVSPDFYCLFTHSPSTCCWSRHCAKPWAGSSESKFLLSRGDGVEGKSGS